MSIVTIFISFTQACKPVHSMAAVCTDIQFSQGWGGGAIIGYINFAHSFFVVINVTVAKSTDNNNNHMLISFGCRQIHDTCMSLPQWGQVIVHLSHKCTCCQTTL